jgi:hypothetical protein
MLDTPVVLCICLYTKIQTAITGIIEPYTQDAYKRNEVQRMPYRFSCIALLNTHIPFC